MKNLANQDSQTATQPSPKFINECENRVAKGKTKNAS